MKGSRMATSKTKDGPTPNGGVKSRIIYLDDAGNTVDEAVATQATIIEYDAAGEVIQRTYGTMAPKKRAAQGRPGEGE